MGALLKLRHLGRVVARGLLEERPSASCGSPRGLQPTSCILQVHEPVGVAKQWLSPTWDCNSFIPPLSFSLPPSQVHFSFEILHIM